MNAAPLISVVVPAWNAAATIGATLDSLVAQGVSDWQAIVVDDGSTDATPDILAARAAPDPRVRVLRQPNAGASAARNAGLAAATGRWLLFLDGDDWIDPAFFRTMLDALDAAPDAVAAFCAYRRVMPDGTMTSPRIAAQVAGDPLGAFARSCAAAIHTVLIDRAALVRAGGFDPALVTCEDWDLWQRVARMGGRWIMVDAPLSFYRASQGSLTRDMARMIADARIVIDRGFGPDLRVDAASPALAAGAPVVDGEDAERALAWFALWTAAQDIGAGGNGAIDDALLARIPRHPDVAQRIAHVLIDAILPGGRFAEPDLARRWIGYGPALTLLIERMGAVWGDPVAARRVQYRVEDIVLDWDDLSEPRVLALTIGLKVSATRPRPLILPGGIDRVRAWFVHRGRVRATSTFAALGTVTPREWAAMLDRAEGGSRASGLRAAIGDARYRIERVAGDPVGRTAPLVRRLRRRLTGVAPQTTPTPGSHAAALAAIAHDAIAEADAAIPVASVTPQQIYRGEPANYGEPKSFWDNLFDAENPWQYESAYEQEKYDRQLAMLPDRPIARALELACAEGHFTVRLAERVGSLLATDIAPKATARAADRCRAAGRTNVTFDTLDLAKDDIPSGMDLIFCSEVLYYLSDTDELSRVTARLAQALPIGGTLITAHAFVLKDDPARTGFDWDQRYGVATISRAFAKTPGLALEYALETELYRIERFVRTDGAHPVPVTEAAEVSATLQPDVARLLIRGGVSARRADVAIAERYDRVPVLMYHSVADEGPAALARYRLTPAAFAEQLKWLRSNGYHTITSDQLYWFMMHRQPVPGRPVMLTFDDGMQDFADHAWPLLRDHDFVAEMFVVTDHVGGHATWDRAMGDPGVLMDGGTIARLAGEGVRFGSHLATHRAADGLSGRDLARELLRSRAMIEGWTGVAPTAYAAPFSLTDARLGIMARECGYRVGFGAESGVAPLSGDPIDLPRIEIRGDHDIATFADLLTAAR